MHNAQRLVSPVVSHDIKLLKICLLTPARWPESKKPGSVA